MTFKEIKCWDDAGSWESAQALIGDSMFNYFTAVWKAIQERYINLGIRDIEVDHDADMRYGDRISVCCNIIANAIRKMIPFFAKVDENDNFTVTIQTPFCAEPIHITPNAKTSFQEWDLPPGAPSWGQKYLYLHMVDHSMILTAEQIGYSVLLERNPATVNFTPFDADELLERYPLNSSLSIAEFLWNAYCILKLLYCPVRSVNLSWNPAEKTYGTGKGFVLYHHSDGSSSYVLEPDYPPEEEALVYSERQLSENAVWNAAEWGPRSGDVSEMKREIVLLNSGSTVWIVAKTTAGALIRNSSYCRLSPRTQVDLPLNLTYERMYMRSDDGYFAPPYPEGEWIGAVDDLISAAGNASYMENEITRPAGGTGYSADSKRHCRLQVEVGLRYGFGFQFL